MNGRTFDMINNRHGPHPAVSYYRPGAPPGSLLLAWLDPDRTGNAEWVYYARGMPPKTIGLPGNKNYTGPPGLMDNTGPPWLSDYTGPPGLTDNTGPPRVSDYTGPPGTINYSGPPWVCDYTGPPGKMNYTGPPGTTGVASLLTTSAVTVSNKHGPPGCAIPISQHCSNAADRERHVSGEVRFRPEGESTLALVNGISLMNEQVIQVI
jgi:hypothetical protein